MSHRCVFLDRDGTINEEVNYLNEVAQFRLIDRAEEGIARLNRSGFKVVVVTNQAAVARGYLTEETLADIHARMLDLLRSADASVDGIYYCPHHPTAGLGEYKQECVCRKPKPGMLVRAAEELDINLNESVIVGDKISDLSAGHAVQCKTVLVRTGYGLEHERQFSDHPFHPTAVVNDLFDASEWIVREFS